MKQPLAEWKRIGGENNAVDQCVPAVSLAFVDRFAIALNESEIFHGAEAIKLSLANVAAGQLEFTQCGIRRELSIQLEQFANVILAGELIRSVDLAVFERAERLLAITKEKFTQSAKRMNFGELMGAGDRAERGQLIGRA